MPDLQFSDLDASAVAALAAKIACCARTGDVITLTGDLGAGKTTFASAFIRALPGGEKLLVTSPTFALLQTYPLPEVEVWHFDLYRVEREEELYELGLEEAFMRGITLIEWPQRAGGMLPEHLAVHIMFNNDNKAQDGVREITLQIPERLMARFGKVGEDASGRNAAGTHAAGR